MLQVEAPKAATTGHLVTGELRKNKYQKIPGAMPEKLSISFSAIEIEGADMCHDPKEVSVARIAEAMRLARVHGKEELMIADITPEIHTDQPDACQVPLIKKEIEAFLQAACTDDGFEMPECRLDLHGGQFGLRCYLGRTKPTDFIFAEDRLSDSR